MPAAPTSLTVVAAASTPAGAASIDEQASDESAGNKFLNTGDVLLYMRNTTAGAITVNFYLDVFGAEVTIMTVSVPGSGTEHGVRVAGPFPAERFNDHSTTVSSGADQGYVQLLQASGSAGDIVFSPIRFNRSLVK